MIGNSGDRSSLASAALLVRAVLLFVGLGMTTSGCAWARTALGERADQCDQLCDQARLARERGAVDEAERLLHVAVEQRPADPEARWQLAEVLLADGRMTEAAEELTWLIDRDPEDCRSLALLAEIRFEQQQYAEAMDLANQVVQLQPCHLKALLLKARLEEQRDDPEAALTTYHRVLQSDPENAHALLRMAAVQLRRGTPDQAAPLLRSLAQSNRAPRPRQIEAVWLLGMAYAQMSRWADAAQAFDSVIRERDATADDWYRLAYARYQSRDFAAASNDIQELLRRDPRHAQGLAMAQNLAGVIPAYAVSAQGIAPAGWEQPVVR